MPNEPIKSNWPPRHNDREQPVDIYTSAGLASYYSLSVDHVSLGKARRRCTGVAAGRSITVNHMLITMKQHNDYY